MTTPFDGVLKRARIHLSTDADGDQPLRPLRTIRRGEFMSITDLAARSGVSTKTIVEIELGRARPRFTTIRKLSDALGVRPGDVAEFVATIT